MRRQYTLPAAVQAWLDSLDDDELLQATQHIGWEWQRRFARRHGLDAEPYCVDPREANQRATGKRRLIYERTNFACHYCGAEDAWLVLDHVIPRRQGGRTTLDNLVAACVQCNSAKGGRTPEEWRS